MNYYRACHYNKLFKVPRQKGQVGYIIFPYVTLMDDLNGFQKLENFILSLNVF